MSECRPELLPIVNLETFQENLFRERSPYASTIENRKLSSLKKENFDWFPPVKKVALSRDFWYGISFKKRFFLQKRGTWQSKSIKKQKIYY